MMIMFEENKQRIQSLFSSSISIDRLSSDEISVRIVLCSHLEHLIDLQSNEKKREESLSAGCSVFPS